MEVGIAGDEAAGEGPGAGVGGEAGADGVGGDIRAGRGEGALLALVGAQDVIVRLMLPAVGCEQWREVLAQETAGGALVGGEGNAEPDEVEVVGHQRVDRTKEVLAEGGVQGDLAEFAVKVESKPVGAAVGDGVGPEDEGVGAVVFGGKAGR